MKKIFTYLASAMLIVALFASCSKYDYYNDESYWLSQDRGIVVYSSFSCPYIVVETSYGYTIMHSNSTKTPYEGDVVYGNLSRTGYQTYYNRTTALLFTATTTDYWLSYGEAQYFVDQACY